MNENKSYTIAGTDIEEVRQKNAGSGMSYNEAKAYIARTTGGHNTRFLSDTDVETVRAQNQKSNNSTKG